MAADPGLDNDQLQLCFNCAHFQRSDFKVERFVNLARKRATLDQLHNDLRTYLRHLQNSMIELINDDYADFVNLSSGLAALRESVDKVREDVKTNWLKFDNSILDLEKCADSVEQCLTELTESRCRQTAARNKMSLVQSIQRLHSLLIDRPKKANYSWFSKLLILVFSVELLSRQISSEAKILQQIELTKSKCYQEVRDLLIEAICEELNEIAGENNSQIGKTNLPIIFAPIQLINQQENAMSRIITKVIGPKIIEKIGKADIGKQRKDLLLEKMLDELLKLRNRWKKHTKESNQFIEEISTFLDICLLNFVISFLDEYFSTILVPSDARLFHRCFQLINYRLIRRWPSQKCPKQTQILRSIRDKFNLVVYFKLAFQPLLLPLKDQSTPEAFTFSVIPLNESAPHCLCPFSNSLLSTLEAIYSPELFLPVLANKFWDFTLERMQDYAKWTTKMIDYFNSAESTKKKQKVTTIPTVASSSNIAATGRRSASPFQQRESSPIALLPPTPNWLYLAALKRDLQLFDAQLFQFCLSNIWVHLRQIRVDPTPFGQCISHFSKQLAAKGKDIDRALIVQIEAELAKNLAAVSEIPRQYRWTKRPQPIGFSQYLATAFQICERFGEETVEKLGWDEAEMRKLITESMTNAGVDFCERAEKVLDAVEQTGSSLLRFKQRKTAVAGQQNATEMGNETTDEAKIRAQLCFDVNLVRQRAEEYGVDESILGRLKRIEERAAVTNPLANNAGE